MNIAKHMELIFVAAVIALCGLAYQAESQEYIAVTAQTVSQNTVQQNA